MIKTSIIENSKDMFVVGTYCATSPIRKVEEFGKDFKMIKEHGLNTVGVWVIWGWMEPEPGKYRFDEMDRIFDLAEENGLSIVPAIMPELQPFWITRTYPQAYMVNNYGQKIISTTGEFLVGLTPGQCMDYEEISSHMERFFTSLASRYKDRKNLLRWDAWAELRWSGCSEGILCYCEKTVEKFREWLRVKYGSLEDLNKVWSRNYCQWEDIFPPKVPQFYDYIGTLDWKRYMVDRHVRLTKLRVKALKKGDPNHKVMVHTGGSGIIFNSQIPCNGIDDWKIAKSVDAYGTAFYPKVFIPEPTPSRCFLAIDSIRSASKDKPFWMSEFQGGYGNKGFGKKELLSAAEQKLWFFSSIAAGAKGILFFTWTPDSTGNNSPGFGLTTTDDSPTELANSIKPLSQIMSKYGALFKDAKPISSQAAILFDPDAYIFNWTVEGSAEMAAKSMEGYYQAFWENNIQCDFIHIDDLSEVSRYQILILAFYPYLKKETAEKIKEYVNRGGIVISDAYLGRSTDNCFCTKNVPGNGLDQVFGAREKKIEQTDEVKMQIVKNTGYFEKFKPKEVIKGYYFKESFEPLTGGKVLGIFDSGEPAIIASRYGKGKTLLIGTLLGYAYQKGLT